MKIAISVDNDSTYKSMFVSRIWRYVDRPYSILVVDDEPMIRAVLAKGLGRAGHRVAACASPEEAMLAVREGRFDVAILDLEIGRASGRELAKQLHAVVPALRIVFHTGSADEAEVGRAAAEGVVVRKPSDISEVLAGIRRA